MSEDKRIPPEGSWAGKHFNPSDVELITGYVTRQAQRFFSNGMNLPVIHTEADPQHEEITVRMNFPVHPAMFSRFVYTLQQVFDRPVSAYGAGITHVIPAEPGTPEAPNSFTLKGNPRQLLEQILVNTHDLDQLAKDFPWNKLGSTQGRGL
jgi:hypothetical protein